MNRRKKLALALGLTGAAIVPQVVPTPAQAHVSSSRFRVCSSGYQIFWYQSHAGWVEVNVVNGSGSYFVFGGTLGAGNWYIGTSRYPESGSRVNMPGHNSQSIRAEALPCQ